MCVFVTVCISQKKKVRNHKYDKVVRETESMIHGTWARARLTIKMCLAIVVEYAKLMSTA